jgi:hypothetical protein
MDKSTYIAVLEEIVHYVFHNAVFSIHILVKADVA